MPEYVGDLFVRIVPDGTALPAGISQIMSSVQKDLATKVSLDTTEATQNVVALGRTVQENIGGAFIGAASQAAAFTGSLYAARGMVNKVRGELQQLYDPLVKAQAGFKAVLGQDKGSKLLNDIRQFAKDSPFVTGELVNYSQQLLGVGQSADSIIPLLNSTGDLVASLGGSQQSVSRVLFTLTQIRSMGRLMGQDAMQLQSAQVPITKLLAESLNVPLAQVKKLQEQGKISADQVFTALTQAGDKVKGSMNAVTNTIEGARSVLQDTITIMFQNQPVLRNIYDDIVKAIKAIANVLGSNDFTNTLNNFFTQVEKAYKPVKTFLTEFAAASGKMAMVGFKTFTDVLKVFATVISSIPQPALQFIARWYATIATIKAPLMLMRYVDQFKTIFGLVSNGTMARAIQGVADGVTSTGNAAERASFKLGLFSKGTEILKSKLLSAGARIKTDYLDEIMGRTMASGPNKPGIPMSDIALRYRLALASREGADPSMFLFNDKEMAKFAQRNDPELMMARMMTQRKMMMGAAMIGSIASQYIPENNAGEAAAKGALSMGSMGAMAAIGLSSGGLGIAAAAAGGALVGGITSYIRKSSEMEKAMIEKWKKIGDDSYKAWTESQAGIITQQNQATIDAYVSKIDYLNEKLRAGGPSDEYVIDLKSKIDTLQQIQNSLPGGLTNIRTGDTLTWRTDTGMPASMKAEKSGAEMTKDLETYRKQLDAIKNDRATRTAIQKEIENATNDLNKLTGKYSVAIQEILRSSPDLDKFFNKFTNKGLLATFTAFDKTFRIDMTKVKDLDMALRGMNSSLTDIGSVGAPVMAALIQHFLDMPSAVKAATAAVNAFNLAWEEAAASKNLDPFNKQAKAIQSVVGAAKSLRSALTEVTTENAANVIGEINTAAQTEYNLVYARSLKSLENMPGSDQQKKSYAQQQATSAQNMLMAQSFLNMRKQLHMTDDEFKTYMTTLGYYEEYQVAMNMLHGQNITTIESYRSSVDKLYTSWGNIPKIETGAKASLLTVSKLYGVTINDLAKILNLQGKITPNMEITVTADVNQAAERLSSLYNLAKSLGFRSVNELVQSGYTPSMTGYVPGVPGAGEAAAVNKYNIDWAKQFFQTARGGGGGGGGNPLQQAADALKQAFESGAASIKQAATQWQTTVKQAVQYDQAVSMSTMLKNTRKQTSDMNALNADLVQLKKRGLTEDAINALGITGVKDLKQVQKLMRSSDADLAAFSAAVAERNKAATDLAEKRKAEENKKNMVEAILTAAKLLGYKNIDEALAGQLAAGVPEAGTYITLRTDDPVYKKMVDDLLKKLQGTGIVR